MSVNWNARMPEASRIEWLDYIHGQTLWMDLQAIDACENDAQRRGWLDANRYSAECEPLYPERTLR